MFWINQFIVNYYEEYSKNPSLGLLNNFLQESYGVGWNMRDPITRRYFEQIIENATSHLYKKRRKT